jgi:hypothetical protein
VEKLRGIHALEWSLPAESAGNEIVFGDG